RAESHVHVDYHVPQTTSTWNSIFQPYVISPAPAYPPPQKKQTIKRSISEICASSTPLGRTSELIEFSQRILIMAIDQLRLIARTSFARSSFFKIEIPAAFLLGRLRR